jgi:hypothetical protein
MMPKREPIHALLVEEGHRPVPGALYATLCGTSIEYEAILPETVRTRFVCALCHQEQMRRLATALEDLRERFNHHLEAYHLELPRKDHE